ncbi:MAG: TIGR03618 family F420-dependent PPOX class oxidoreductase [Microbacterium sp.]|uniref:TIGR03618 family F420-dependent PPOX class oxidoreductase n=1 Tax=Microbacterium sp. TaxID=51671 RepID=UPI001AD549A1|nr:TIGR03618 family F420-dependent PPOX class oxidoreductase [Microbacterium sp.]MBN9154679.1 TIGR03618 family F420-dependent PPOX class oxidoreductase [Microbacterium sp.]MBN9175471.1 TIGR03618 family F420-dependent PPOX class oxidoreductase [Microbacterium sp.]MBN9183295.1 TIGR03618 family F420-dependent PPOX class oxidoreductase [Microbacterium sp.]
MTDFRLDPADDVQGRALAALESEEIGWLGSTGRDGFPHAVPVWFLWHDDAVVVFSQPHAAKARNLRADPRAMFHLEAGDDGERLAVLQGTAELSEEPSSVWAERIGDAYAAKYRDGLARLNLTLDGMAEDYSLTIVVRPHKLIAW